MTWSSIADLAECSKYCTLPRFFVVCSNTRDAISKRPTRKCFFQLSNRFVFRFGLVFPIVNEGCAKIPIITLLVYESKIMI